MTVSVTMTAEVFRRFAIFDTFRRRRMWRSPAIFAGILTPCAMVCYAMDHVEGAVMLGTVLLLVGLGMPITYFTAFFVSLARQVRSLGLPKEVYTLTLEKDIAIENGQEQFRYAWKDVHHAYRDRGATYLFLTPTRAFLLPHPCTDEEALWKLLTKKLPKEKLTTLTRR